MNTPPDEKPGEETLRELLARAHELEALAVRFEVKHPALAQALRELIDELGKAGI
jgi:Domain of unknown function (DUF4404)